MTSDSSNGYDAIADVFIARRGRRPTVGDAIGAATVRTWAETFPPGATVLDQDLARASRVRASFVRPGSPPSRGRFLFTAHREPLEWLDAMTGRQSRSLGAATYQQLLRAAGLVWVGEAQDEGDNHYYFVERVDPTRA